MSKQVLCLLAAALSIAGCSQVSSNPPKARVGGPRGQMPGFPPLEIAAEGPHADLLARANAAMHNGDPDGAIQALEELVQKDPGNRYALMVLAQKLQERGLALAHGREARTGYAHFQKSAKYMRQLKAAVLELSGPEAELYSYALYNDACAEALYGTPDKAISLLEEALRAGFPRPDEIDKDEDFKSLKDDPKFKALLERLRPI
ncbi:MAG TPA: tetratricopeptide repeat protein [Gemmataceae bacterium]|nr:tetratricopeptide repeat protein [Gemmataceae bacterium]